MLHLLRPRRAARVAATTLGALSLAAVSLVAVPAPAAQTDAAAPSLRWEVSPQFDDHLSTHVLEGGATEDEAGVVTFPDGTGSYDAVTGATTAAYEGSVAGSFAFLGVSYYTVTIADPVVTVDEDGHGTVSAVVSASNIAAQGNAAESTQPARVTVTTFDATPTSWVAGADLGTLTATPHWAGVLPPGSESESLGIESGQPVDGKSWAPTFLAQITSGVRAHFYASGSSSDEKKAPATFTASAPAAPAAEEGPAVEVTTTSTSYDDGLELAVSGTGFRAVTNPGDAGVYVGLAQSGGLPDVSSQDGTDAFAAAAWVQPQNMADGTFDTGLDAPTEKLDPDTSYSVYTWQAHTHSNTTQDTETPVEIDWSALAPPEKSAPVLAAKVTKEPTTESGGKLRATVSGDAGTPTGKVRVQLVRAGKVVTTLTRRLGSGRAVVALPALRKGTWKAKVTYLGSASYATSRRVLTFEVGR